MAVVIGNPQWICFISGMEVPIMGASTTVVEGALASAQVTMAYSPFLSKLPKHTKITLFSYDISKDDEPQLEFDGTIQGVSWRQDKIGGNTGLFVIAQTDGMIWSEREKFNFYIDNGFGLPQLLKTTQSSESYNTIATSAVTDPLAHIMSSNNYDAGEVTALMLTHTFEVGAGNVFNGKLTYTDCGYVLHKSNTTIDAAADINPAYFANYIAKFYDNYQVVRKLCRIPIPGLWKEAFQISYKWDLLTKGIQPLEGKVNFWNYITYICDQFSFEVYDIPDASVVTLTSADMYHINNHPATLRAPHNSILAEYMIKPKCPFGPIPYCNIIFPDQVLDKSFFKNYQNEVTRCWTIINTFPINAVGASTQGLAHTGFTGPYFENEASNYFDSFSVGKPTFTIESTNKQFLLRSPYEEEFGVNSRQVELPELLARLLTTRDPLTTTNGDAISQKNYTTLYNMMNDEFFQAYTDKVAFTMQVTPEVDVVPGMSILVLDENDDHILAYCFGREKVWDKNGQKVINLKLRFPRHYSLVSGFANNYMNTLDPKYYASTYKQDLAILSTYLGYPSTSFLDQTKTMQENIISNLESWNEGWQKNTPAMVKFLGYARNHASYSDYLKFYGVSGPKYDIKTGFNVMPEQLVRSWELSSETVAEMPALQYTYATDGYLNPQSTATQQTIDGTSYPPYYLPSYDELNTPGPIIISPWICGIVNCHNRYLMQVGNYIS